MGLYYGLDRVVRHDADIEQLVRERPELGPWESYYQPASRDKIMSALLRRNIRFYADIFTYNDTDLPREPKFQDASARFIALETASMRFSPIFKGVCLYDEFYNSGSDNGNIAVGQMNYAAQEVAYRAQYAKEGYTSARAYKSLDRFAGPPVRPKSATTATWRCSEPGKPTKTRIGACLCTHVQRQVSELPRHGPMGSILPRRATLAPPATTCMSSGAPADVFRGLDAATCVMYKDGGIGDRPVFAPMQADVLRYRDDIPVWTQIHRLPAPAGSTECI